MRKSIKIREEEVNLELVAPLLKYLDALKPNHEDRELTREEDRAACEIVYSLNIPACKDLKDYIDLSVTSHTREKITLVSWYMSARLLAGFIGHCEQCF